MIHVDIEKFIACPDLYRAYKLYRKCIEEIEKSEDVFLSEDTFMKIRDKMKYPGSFFFDPAENRISLIDICISYISRHWNPKIVKRILI